MFAGALSGYSVRTSHRNAWTGAVRAGGHNMNLILEGREADHVKVACQGNLTVMPSTGQGDGLKQVVGADCFEQRVLLNMAGTNYVDSSGVSWLLVTHSRFVDGGGKLVIHSAPPRVRETFDLL